MEVAGSRRVSQVYCDYNDSVPSPGIEGEMKEKEEEGEDSLDDIIIFTQFLQ